MRRLLVLALGFLALTAPAPARAQTAPRHVVLIIADDLGMQLGCYGNKVIRTPHLDGLAKNGVRFSRAYATVSSCSPSRASIFTGLFTHQNGQYGLQHAPHSQQTHAWVMGLPRLLRMVGYYTGIIGKIDVSPQAGYNWDAEHRKGQGRNAT